MSWDRVETVILDIDGTLLDLNFDDHVWNRVLPERFAELHRLDVTDARDEIEKRLHQHRGTLAWYCFDHWFDLTGIPINDIEQELLHLVRIRPLVLEFLKFLQQRGLQVIFATNAHPTSLSFKMDIVDFGERFFAVKSSHEYGYAKENLKFWRSLQAEFAFDPAKSLLIDDNISVLQAARQYGIEYLFGVKFPNLEGTAISSSEFHCLDSFSELIEFNRR